MYANLSKSDRIAQYREDNSPPQNYVENEVKEEVVIRYVNQFYIQIREHYPKLPKLLLTVPNEYGQNKFISTYIKPTLLAFDELYDSDSCAEYFADHVMFEELENNAALPKCVQSPSMTLVTQRGDCFDRSVLLTSLLIGAGYNAYACYGTAGDEIVKNLTDKKVYDLKSIALEKKIIEEKKVQEERKYKLKNRPTLKSNYAKKVKNEEKKPEGEEKKDGETVTTQEEEETKVQDFKKYTHCWVVIFPSSRQVENILVVETGSGKIVALKDTKLKDYLTVHAIFNHENYWVNMKPELHVKELKYNLDDKVYWERIFLKEDENISQTVEEELKQDILDLPLSWVNNLFIPKPRFNDRFALKSKTTEFSNAIVRRSCPFFEKDLSVKQVLVFTPGNKHDVFEKHYFFEKRKDKLRRRAIFLTPEKKEREIVELFNHGRTINSTEFEGLVKFRRLHGIKDELTFYSKARLDGLQKVIKYYQEKTNELKKVECHFDDRGDKLIYRSFKYDRKGTTIIKQSEKYQRDLSKDASDDISKIIFFPEKYKVMYHFADNKITRSTKEFQLSTMEFSMDVVSKYTKKPTAKQALEDFKFLTNAKKRSDEEIFRVLQDVSDILNRRKLEESNIEFETSKYDIVQNQLLRNKQVDRKKKGDVEGEEESKKIDIIKDLVPQEGINDRKIALRIFNSALARTRSRVLARTKIMENRLREEKAQMNKKRIQYQKQDTGTQQKEEDFLRYWEKTMFKMEILKQRCEINQEEAKIEYQKVQKELLDDKRMRKFLTEERRAFYSSKKKSSFSIQ